jgi:transcription elongation GreA/GreB family factor
MPRAPQLPEKHRVRDAVLEKLAEQLAQAVHVADDARRGATHEEAKPENDKDTRALEQSYLARGQALRAEQLTEARDLLRFLPLPQLTGGVAAAGALVVLEAEDGAQRVLFLAPVAGGIEVSVEGTLVQVVTPASPLGAALLGRAPGDDVSVLVRGVRREYVVAQVL